MIPASAENETRIGVPTRDDAAADRATVTIMLLIPFAAFALLPRREAQCVDPRSVLSTVNPNTAPAWELTILPGIGEVRAQDIVTYRKSRATGPQSNGGFSSMADLEAVPGIGPVTALRLAAETRFED